MTPPIMFLIGGGVSHSLSPVMWNHLFVRTRRVVRYSLRDVPSTGLDAVLRELRSGTVLAANVTMPHKQWAASVMDVATDEAVATQAVNLIRPIDDRLHGANTDVTGARWLFARRAPFRRALILGAGGTAAGLLESLVGLAAEVVVTNRTEGRAAALVDTYADRFDVIRSAPWSHRDDEASASDLLVSTVPVIASSPIDLARVSSTSLIYDVMYRSTLTALQQESRERGIPLADGLSHLAAQAITALEDLGIEADAAPLLVEGLERATSRAVTAWGEPLL